VVNSIGKKLLSEGKEYEAYYQFGIVFMCYRTHIASSQWISTLVSNEGATDLVKHATQELFYPGFNSNLQNVTNTFLDWFEIATNHYLREIYSTQLKVIEI